MKTGGVLFVVFGCAVSLLFFTLGAFWCLAPDLFVDLHERFARAPLGARQGWQNDVRGFKGRIAGAMIAIFGLFALLGFAMTLTHR